MIFNRDLVRTDQSLKSDRKNYAQSSNDFFRVKKIRNQILHIIIRENYWIYIPNF